MNNKQLERTNSPFDYIYSKFVEISISLLQSIIIIRIILKNHIASI